MVVGGDEFAGETAVGGDSKYTDVLRTHRPLHLLDELGDPLGVNGSGEAFQVTGVTLEAVSRRIDGTTDEGRVLVRRSGKTDCEGEVIQFQDRAMGLRVNDLAGGKSCPTCGRTHQEDIFLVRVQQHLVNSLESREVADRIGQRSFGLQVGRNGGLEAFE